MGLFSYKASGNVDKSGGSVKDKEMSCSVFVTPRVGQRRLRTKALAVSRAFCLYRSRVLATLLATAGC